VRQVGYLQRLYRDTRSTEHKIQLSYLHLLHEVPIYQRLNIFYSLNVLKTFTESKFCVA